MTKLQIRQAVRRFVTRAKNAFRAKAIFRFRRATKKTTHFTIRTHDREGKSPLDMLLDHHYLEVVYGSEVDLEDFFKWASVEMLDLETFFRQAQYEEANNYDLESLFRRASNPPAAQYDLATFFRSAAYPTAPEYDLEEFFGTASVPKAQTKLVLDPFFQRHHQVEDTFQRLARICKHVQSVMEVHSSIKIAGIVDDRIGKASVPLKIRRRNSCTLEEPKPIKRCLSAPII